MIIHVPNIKELIYEAYPDLSGLAETHVKGLETVLTLYTNTVEEFIRRHCEQIYLHLEPEPDNEQQKLVKQKILDISKGKSPRETLKEEIGGQLIFPVKSSLLVDIR